MVLRTRFASGEFGWRRMGRGGQLVQRARRLTGRRIGIISGGNTIPIWISRSAIVSVVHRVSAARWTRRARGSRRRCCARRRISVAKCREQTGVAIGRHTTSKEQDEGPLTGRAI